MDYKRLVQSKLQGDDVCSGCLLASVVEGDAKVQRVIALVQCKDEHGIFVYGLAQGSAGALALHTAIPIDSAFNVNIVSQQLGATLEGFVPVRLGNKEISLIVDLPQTDHAGNLLSEIKQSIAVQSQNTGFGLPSSFSWIDKYQSTLFNNPFTDDVFDPFKNQTSAPGGSDGGAWMQDILSQPSTGATCPVVTATESNTDNMNPSYLGHQGQGHLQGHQGHQSYGSDNNLVSASSNLPGESSVRRSFEKSLDDGLGDSLRSGKGLTGREHILKLVLKQHEDEFTELRNFTIFCGTWNVNGQAASEDCSPWLHCDMKPPDIYAIGFQELDLSKNAYIFSDSAKEEEWFQRVYRALHPKARYIKLKLMRIVGIMLIVFIKEEHVTNVYDVMGASVGTGLMGMMGNKGGAGVRFDLFNTSVCFVNSHLAAHTEEYERRNQDFRDINSRMNFRGISGEAPLTIAEHDAVFWIGDLNYRLSGIENERVKDLVAKGQFTKLMQNDQLVRQIEQKRVFLDYVEGAANFAPTYKYDVGTDTYDTSEKARTPSWTDRILWRGSNIKQIIYRSHQELKLSDHKPVSAVFDVGIKEIDRVKHRKTYEDVMKRLDRYENEFLPQVKVDVTDIHFPDVKFIEPQTRTITVANTGQVPVEFEFIKKLTESAYCKPWLSAEPSRAVINVGETCEVMIEVYVHKDTAWMFNSGQDRMEDILVLHLEGGKDLFISVSGSYIPSSFGSSIEALVHMFGPVREIPTAKLIELNRGRKEGGTGSTTDRPLDIPKEIWRLVGHLYEYGLNQAWGCPLLEDLFQAAGYNSEVQAIRDSLDTGTPAKIPGQLNSVAEALLLFLESLAEPVIPYPFYTKCLDSCSNFTLCKQVLSQMPVAHRNVFKYVCAFLREVLQHSNKRATDVKILAPLFGRMLLRAPPGLSLVPGETPGWRNAVMAEERKKAAFMYHFLSNEYD